MFAHNLAHSLQEMQACTFTSGAVTVRRSPARIKLPIKEKLQPMAASDEWSSCIHDNNVYVSETDKFIDFINNYV